MQISYGRHNQTIDIVATSEPPSAHALAQFNKVLAFSDYVGPLYLRRSRYVSNALATSKPVYQPTPYGPVLSRYDFYVIYNPDFMRDMAFRSGNDFATAAIFAHEIGHHFCGHVINGSWNALKHPWAKECEAEYHSGYILARLGAQPKDLQLCERLLFSWWGSPTHPDSIQRIGAVVKGWKDAGGVGVAEDDLQSIYQQFMYEQNRW